MAKAKDSGESSFTLEASGQAWGVSGEGLPPGPVVVEIIWPASIQTYDCEVGEDGRLDVRGPLPESHRGDALARLYAGADRELLASTSATYKA